MAHLEDQRETIYKVDPANPETKDLPILRTEELLLNMGPQHPATHGVLKVILDLEGERITKSTVVMGFLHRGVEKLAEHGTYHQFIPHTDRLDYVCAMYNNFAYCRAVEKLMNVTVPERAEYLRTIGGGNPTDYRASVLVGDAGAGYRGDDRVLLHVPGPRDSARLVR